MFLASAPCPTGWHFDPSKTHELAKLEVDCGLFPLKKAVNGEVTHTLKKAKWRPVEDYLRAQGRFRHLADAHEMQAAVDRYWNHRTTEDTHL
jgi:pyruvate ferredoxin oxidoreductase beta subunit